MTRLVLAALLGSATVRADPVVAPDLVKALVDAGDWRKHDLAPPAPQSYIVTIDRSGLHGPRGSGVATGLMLASGAALMAAHAEGSCDSPLCAIAFGLAAAAAVIDSAAKHDE